MFEAVNPFYWWWAGLISAPIIIHLINRLRYKRVRWAAMEFLLKSQQKNRRKLILEQLILLAMRCLLVMLAVALVVRPTWLLGDAGRTADLPTYHVVVLDDSLSMQDVDDPVAPNGLTAFQRAVKTVTELAQKQSEQPNQFWTVLKLSDPEVPELGRRIDQLAGQPPGQLLTGDEARRLGERLEALRCTYLPLQPLTAVTTAQKYLQLESAEGGRRYLHLVGDFRRRDWSETGSDEVAQVLGELARTAKVQVRLHDVAQPARGINRLETPQPHANLGILNLVTRSRPKGEASESRSRSEATVPLRVVTPRLPFDLHATVKNFSATELRNVRLTAFVEGREVATRILDRLSGGEERPVVFNLEFAEADTMGLKPLSVRLDPAGQPDHLLADNVRYTYLELKRDIPVLLVDPDQGGSMEMGTLPDSFYVATALAGSSRTGLRPERIRPAEVKNRAKDLDQYPVIYLLNVAGVGNGSFDLDAAGLAALEGYVARGGSVVFFLGPRVNVLSYNEQFWKKGQGLFPVPLSPRPNPEKRDNLPYVNEPPDESDLSPKIRFVQEGHPGFRFTGDIANLLASFVTINCYFKVEPTWKPGANTKVVIQLANRQPLTAYRTDALRLAELLAKGGDKAKVYADQMTAWVTDADRKRAQKAPLIAAVGGALGDAALADFWKDARQKELRAELEKFQAALLAGDPLVVESAVGPGHVLAFLTTAGPMPLQGKDYGWNNWANEVPFTYVPMMLMVYDHLAALARPASDQEVNRVIGPPTEIRLESAKYSAHVELWHQGDGEAKPQRADVIRPRETEKDLLVRINPVRGPGFYLLRLNQPAGDGPRPKGEAEDRPLAFNVEGTLEGDLRRISENEVLDKLATGLQKGNLKMAQLEAQGFVESRTWFVQTGEGQTDEVVRNQSWSDYSWVLLALILILLLEQYLAMRFSHHMPPGAVASSGVGVVARNLGPTS